MDRMTKEILDDFQELTHEYLIEEETALKLMDIEAKWGIARAIRDCFERTFEFPNIQEAIVMAGETMGRNISEGLETLSEAF